VRLCDDAALREAMRIASRENAASRTWENAFRTIWDDAPSWN
jgi:hypothetical protein